MTDKPFTLRMAGHELLGVERTERILERSGPAWLATVLLAYVEGNGLQTPTATLLRDWHDRKHART